MRNDRTVNLYNSNKPIAVFACNSLPFKKNLGFDSQCQSRATTQSAIQHSVNSKLPECPAIIKL